MNTEDRRLFQFNFSCSIKPDPSTVLNVQWIQLLKGYTVTFCAFHHIIDCLISVTSRLTVSNPAVSLVLAGEGMVTHVDQLLNHSLFYQNP